MGQHSLLVVEYAEQDGITDPVLLLTLLMHDAPEYILRDMLAPVKQYLSQYRVLENFWWQAIATRFGLPLEMNPLIKEYDLIAAASEKATLISPLSGEWPGLPAARKIGKELLGLTIPESADRFLALAEKLICLIYADNGQ